MTVMSTAVVQNRPRNPISIPASPHPELTHIRADEKKRPIWPWGIPTPCLDQGQTIRTHGPGAANHPKTNGSVAENCFVPLSRHTQAHFRGPSSQRDIAYAECLKALIWHLARGAVAVLRSKTKKVEG